MPMEEFLVDYPECHSPGMVRGAVGAVDGGIGTVGHCAGIEDQSLIEDIQTDRGFGQKAFCIIGAR